MFHTSAFVSPVPAAQINSINTQGFVNKCSINEKSAASSKAPATIRMVGQGENPEEGWKTLFAGGFPGGEGFFKKWVADGMKDDVPYLPGNKQPAAGIKSIRETIPPRASEVSDKSFWRSGLTAGGFPGGEAFYKKWVADGFQQAVPGTDYTGPNTPPAATTKTTPGTPGSAPKAAAQKAPQQPFRPSQGTVRSNMTQTESGGLRLDFDVLNGQNNDALNDFENKFGKK